MPNTQQTQTELLADFADNTSGDITAQDVRNLVVSTIHALPEGDDNVFVAQAADVIPLVVQGASGQTANLLEFQDSSSTVLSYIDANGNFSKMPEINAGNVVWYNASGSPTVIVPTSNTNVDRGTALLSAVAAVTVGGGIRLGAFTFDVGIGGFVLPPNTYLIGSGIDQTFIVSETAGPLDASTPTTTIQLSNQCLLADCTVNATNAIVGTFAIDGTAGPKASAIAGLIESQALGFVVRNCKGVADYAGFISGNGAFGASYHCEDCTFIGNVHGADIDNTGTMIHCEIVCSGTPSNYYGPITNPDVDIGESGAYAAIYSENIQTTWIGCQFQCTAPYSTASAYTGAVYAGGYGTTVLDTCSITSVAKNGSTPEKAAYVNGESGSGVLYTINMDAIGSSYITLTNGGTYSVAPQTGQFINYTTDNTFTITNAGSESAGGNLWVLSNNTARTATLPAANQCAGQTIIIQDASGGTAGITVLPAGSDTINGTTSIATSIAYARIVLTSNGIYWFGQVETASNPPSLPLSVANGGTGDSTLTSGKILQGNGTGAITSTLTAPSGAVVGTSDSQVLTNKTIAYASNTLTGVASSGANSNITSLTGLTTPLSVAQGGTGENTLTTGSVLIGKGTSGIGTAGANGSTIKLDVSTTDLTFTGANGETIVANGSIVVTGNSLSALSLDISGYDFNLTGANGETINANDTTGAITIDAPNTQKVTINSVAFPNGGASANTVPVVTSSNTITYETVPVAAGGTGASTLPSGTLLTGNGTGAITHGNATVGGTLTLGGDLLTASGTNQIKGTLGSYLAFDVAESGPLAYLSSSGGDSITLGPISNSGYGIELAGDTGSTITLDAPNGITASATTSQPISLTGGATSSLTLDGSDGNLAFIGAGGAFIVADGSGNITIYPGVNLILENLPSSDPGITGAVYTGVGGALFVSAG